MKSRIVVIATVLTLAGCSNENKPLDDEQIYKLIKQSTINRKVEKAWAATIRTSLRQLNLKVDQHHSCAVISVIEQESSFNADPVVPGIQNILLKKLNALEDKLIVGHLVKMRLDTKAKNGKTFRQNINEIRTERQMGDWYSEFTASNITAPLLTMMNKDLDTLISTVGSMQVSIKFSRQYAEEHGINSLDMRQRLFSRDGGVFFGTAHLLKGGQNYDDVVYNFADFNAGHFASRNAAFQQMVAILSGTKLVADGDLLDYSLDKPSTLSNTFKATVAAMEKNGEYADKKQIEADFLLEKKAQFSTSKTYQRIARLYQAKYQKIQSAVLPNINLASEKITRKLTTAWFANRVKSRYTSCMKIDLLS